MQNFRWGPGLVALGFLAYAPGALTQPFWGVGMVQSGALRGTGDTRFPLMIGSAGIWTAVLLVWIVLTFFGGGLPAVWSAFLITSPITATLSWWRFRHRVRELLAS